MTQVTLAYDEKASAIVLSFVDGDKVVASSPFTCDEAIAFATTLGQAGTLVKAELAKAKPAAFAEEKYENKMPQKYKTPVPGDRDYVAYEALRGAAQPHSFGPGGGLGGILGGLFGGGGNGGGGGRWGGGGGGPRGDRTVIINQTPQGGFPQAGGFPQQFPQAGGFPQGGFGNGGFGGGGFPQQGFGIVQNQLYNVMINSGSGGEWPATIRFV